MGNGEQSQVVELNPGSVWEYDPFFRAAVSAPRRHEVVTSDLNQCLGKVDKWHRNGQPLD